MYDSWPVLMTKLCLTEDSGVERFSERSLTDSACWLYVPESAFKSKRSTETGFLAAANIDKQQDIVQVKARALTGYCFMRIGANY